MNVLIKFLIFGVVALFTFAASPAYAAALLTVGDVAGNFVDDFSGNGELDFDVQWNNLGPVSLSVRVFGPDFPSMVFSGFQTNFSGVPWTDFHIELIGGPTFAEINDLIPSDATIMSAAGDTSAWIVFAEPGPQFDFMQIGNPGPITPGVDWSIDLNGLAAGDIFTMTLRPSVAMPEPGTLALFGLGLAGLGLARRRKAA